MALQTSNPVIRDGKIHDKLGLTMAVSTIYNNQNVGLSVAVRLTPYGVDENGVITPGMPEDDRPIVIGNAMSSAESDPDLRQCIDAIEEALQQYVTIKGV